MIKFENVTYSYSHQENIAVKNINLEIASGKIVLCTGASGCGKTTLMRLANGLCPQHYKGKLEGNVSIFDKNTKDCPINELSLTVGTLFQDPEQQFFALTVNDEMAFSHECRAVEPSLIEEKIENALTSFSISHIRNSSIHELSEGQKQKVGLATLYSQNLKALILDEPTANLDPESTLDLAKKLVELRAEGMAIFVVDHRLYWLENIVDEVIIMSKGKIKERGDFSILYDDELRNKYGLREASVQDKRNSLPLANEENYTSEGLYINKLTFGYKNKDLIFDNKKTYLGKGITALIGDNGTGKTTLARIMTGLNKVQEGEFHLNGNKIEQKDLIKHIGIVLQNADHQLQMRTVLEEIQTCFILADQFNSNKRTRFKIKAEAFTEKSLELLDKLGLKDLAKRHPQSLSGGEKQRLIIASALAKNPSVLILDEPTSGLDGLNMLRIKTALEQFSELGTCILVITHDLELIAKSCNFGIKLPL